MSIYKAGPTPPGKQVIEGLLYQQPTNKTARLQLANNNKNSASPTFQNLNTTIVMLDAQYDALPNQSDWESFAASVEGLWSLCANCDPDSSAKKLYRQVNYNNLMTGSDIVTDPSLLSPVCNTGAILIGARCPAYATFGCGYVGWPNTDCAPMIIAQLGLGTLNPSCYLYGPLSGSCQPGGDMAEFAWAVIQALELYPESGQTATGAVRVCYSGEYGMPGPTITASIYVKADF